MTQSEMHIRNSGECTKVGGSIPLSDLSLPQEQNTLSIYMHGLPVADT